MSEGNRATVTVWDYHGKGKDWVEDCYADFARTALFWIVKDLGNWAIYGDIINGRKIDYSLYFLEWGNNA